MAGTPNLHVVIPAHNEEQLLPRALRALQAAADTADCRLRVLVVADACTDATAEAALAHGAEVLTVALGSVGAARRAGFAHLLGAPDPGHSRTTAGRTVTQRTVTQRTLTGWTSTGQTACPPAGPVEAADWLATTDADSAVPPNWCRRLIDLGRAGADVIAGTVTLEPPDPSSEHPSSGPVSQPAGSVSADGMLTAGAGTLAGATTPAGTGGRTGQPTTTSGAERGTSTTSAAGTYVPTTSAAATSPTTTSAPGERSTAAGGDTLGERWAQLYAERIGPHEHRHIHGANLSFHPRAYQRLNGFAALPVHEDVDLIRRALAAELRVHWPLDIPVLTSRRIHGRSPGGLSDDLKELIR